MMDEQTREPSADYLQGFNEGYLLSRHLPEVAEALRSQLPDSERSAGMKGGMAQYALEHDREQTRDQTRTPPKSHGFQLDWAQQPEQGRDDYTPDLSLEKDDPEPDMDLD